MIKNFIHKSAYKDTTIGQLTGSYVNGTFIYPSTIDNINNLYACYCYDSGLTNMPIYVLGHGASGDADDFYQDVRERFASYKGIFVSFGMRGRNGASGSRDWSGRELYDIYDGIQYVINHFSVNPSKIIFDGYSGGGGNAYGLACKFPDLFSVIVANFGMSDYGYNNGWYQLNTGYRDILLSELGNPSIVPNVYRSRNAVEAINNFKGRLFIFHDNADTAVHYTLSTRMSVFTGRKLISITTSSSSPRWLHGYPGSTSQIRFSEVYYVNDILKSKYTPLPSYGVLRINGFIKTRDFEIWLNNGTDYACDMSYNLLSKTFILNPDIETIVKITFNGQTQIQTINSQTTFIF